MKDYYLFDQELKKAFDEGYDFALEMMRQKGFYVNESDKSSNKSVNESRSEASSSPFNL